MNFSKKMEEMKTYISSEDIENVRKNIQHLKNLPDDIYKGGDLLLFILVKRASDAIIKVRKSLDFYIHTMKYIKENKISIFKSIKNTPDFWERNISLRYTEDMDVNTINYIKEAMSHIIMANPFKKRGIIEGTLSSSEETEIEKDFFKKLDEHIKICSTKQEDEYNVALYEVCSFLNQIGKLSYNLNIHNLRMVELGIPQMQISYDQENGKNLLNKVSDLCDLDVIKKLILESKLIDDGNNIYINPKYIYISNEILADFINWLK